MGMFEDKIAQLSGYAKRAGIPDDFMQDFADPKDFCNVKIRVKTRKRNTFRLMGVLHCNPYSTGARPYKGGFRYHPSVDIDCLSALALDMTEKTALARLKFGGAKFGIAINPADYTEDELRAITEKAAETLLRKRLLGPRFYVPGPDAGTNSKTMHWIYNTVAEKNSDIGLPNVAAVVTGKPVEFDGCPGREDATSRGLLILLFEYLRLVNDFRGRTVAIQGFGNVGMNLAKLIRKDFTIFQVNAVSDVNGAIHNEDGLDVYEVIQYYAQHKTFRGYRDDRYALPNPEALLHLPVDFLIPAAMENQITEENAHLIQAKMIVEAANEAVTTGAQPILEDRNITYIPGIAANAGGVTVSYLEWAHNCGEPSHDTDLPEDLEGVHKRLEKIMKSIIVAVHEKHLEINRPLAEAAHVVALERVWRPWSAKH